MSQPEGELSRARFMLRAFRSRNYRLFFGGQIVSLIGTWLSMVATSWLVYRLATAQSPGSGAFMLGVIGFAGQFPIFLLTPLAGVWVDRWPRQKILIATQALAMLQSFILAWLTLSGTITIPQIIALSVFQGLINALDMPARQTFVVQLVRPADLSNAIALSSSMVHGARLIGPAIAGLLIYYTGEGFCFLIDGFSYLAVLIALLAIRVGATPPPKVARRVWHSLYEGVRYAFGFRPIRVLLGMVAITSLMGMTQSVLMPVFADEILGGQERTLGLLLGASGCGAFIGSLYLAARKTVLGLGKVIAAACCLLGAGLVAFSLSESLPLSLLILAITGCALVVQLASCNTVLQTIVDEDKRGRIMSLFTMSFMGMAPFGSLLGGTLAHSLGARWTLRIAGIVCVACGLLFVLRLKKLRGLVRPIYVQRGIIPEVAEGLGAAAQMTRLGPE